MEWETERESTPIRIWLILKRLLKRTPSKNISPHVFAKSPSNKSTYCLYMSSLKFWKPNLKSDLVQPTILFCKFWRGGSSAHSPIRTIFLSLVILFQSTMKEFSLYFCRSQYNIDTNKHVLKVRCWIMLCAASVVIKA